MAYFPVTPSGARTEETRVAQLVAWPTIAGAVVVMLAIAVPVAIASARTGGHFVYGVDDAYIHMAAARRFLASGDHTFLAASSSIAWPWLLVLLRLVGVTDRAPLLVNVTAAVALFFLVDHALRRADVRRASLVAVAVLALVPIVPLVASGMEHTTHTCFAFALASLTTRAIARDRKIGASILFVGAGAVAFRYEGFFVVAPLVMLLAFRRRHRDAFVLALTAALPALVRGGLAIARNEPFFPVPVLLKRTQLDLLGLPAKIHYRLVDNPHVLVVLVLLTVAWTLDRRNNATDVATQERRALTFVALVVLVLQTTFAQLGWFYRYEAYAMLLALTVLAMQAFAHERTVRAFALPFALLMLPLVGRALGSFRTTIAASENISDQEQQMATFVRAFYDHRAVALNDIGAVAYASDATIVDVMGLASPRIARARGMRIDGALSKGDLDAITHDENVDVAILYEDWLSGSIPSTWHKVGSWQIANNHVCAKDTVSFYATSEGQRAILRENLRAFVKRLPTSVKQSGDYLE